MVDKRVLVIISLILFGCEKDCEENFLNNYQSLQQSFSLLMTTPSSNNASKLKNNLNNFISLHDGVKCKDGGETLDPSAEVKTLLSEISSERKYSSRAEVVAKLVYGEDNRVDLEDSLNSSYRNWGRSTIAQISKNKIRNDGKLVAKTLKDRYSLCDGERFSTQLTAARCSGFLVGPDIVVTAGHCVEDQYDCDENYWVLDYTKDKVSIGDDSIFGCSEIIEQVLDYDTGLDYAVIKIDRKVTDRKFFRWRMDTEKLKVGDPLVVIGNPSGLPIKIADGAEVKDNSENDYFTANLDTFAGNSGSAVINANTGVVEGILVRGETDYIAINGSNGKRCMTINQCSDSNGCDGNFEEVSKMSSVLGIPLGLNESSLVNGIINKNIDNLTSLYGVKLYGTQFAEYQVVGRSFLNKCAIKFISDQSSENEVSINNCSDKNSLLNLVGTYLNKFYY